MKLHKVLAVIPVLIIISLAFLIRVYNLGVDSSYSTDEVTTVTSSMQSLAEMWRLQSKTPLQALWIRFGGEVLGLGYSEFGVYFMSVIAGGLAVAVVYYLGKSLFDNRVGLLGAFMLAFSAYHIYWSRSARYYSLMVLLSSAAFYCLYRALTTNSRKAWLGYALFRTLSLYDHLTALWILPGEAVFALAYLSFPILKDAWKHKYKARDPAALLQLWQDWRARIRVKDIRRWFVSSGLLWFAICMALILLAYAPRWYPLVRDIYLGSARIRLGSIGSMQLTPNNPRVGQPRTVLGGGWNGPFLVLYLLDAWNLPLHVVMMVAFSTGLMFSALRRQWTQLLFVLTLMATTFVLTLTIKTYGLVLNGRYLISLLPLYYLMVGRGISGIGHWYARIFGARGKRGTYVLLGVMITFAYAYAGLSYTKIPLTYRTTGQNWKAVSHFLAKNASPDQLIVVHGVATHHQALRYYLPDFNVVGKDPYVSYDTIYEEEEGFWLVFQPGTDMYTRPRAWVDRHSAVSLIFAGGWWPDIDRKTALAPGQNWDLYVVYVSPSAMTPEQAIELHQDWLAQSEAHNPDDVRIHLTLAEAYRRYNQCNLAVSEYTQALKEGYVNDQVASYIYDSRGSCWHRLGETERAIADWQQAIALADWSDEPYQHLGNAYTELGKSEAAQALYQKGIAANPKKAWPHVQQGDFYRRHGLDEQAIAEYQTAIAIEPGDQIAYQRLGERYAAAGESARGFSLYHEAIRRNPWSGWPHFQLGQFYYRVGKVAEAIDEYQRAVEIDPEYSSSVSEKMDNAKWDLAAVVNLVHVYSDVGELLWWPGNSWVKPHPFEPDVMAGNSTLTVGGKVQSNQLFLHPFSQEENTYIEFEIPDLPFSNLKVGYGLADTVAGRGDGVQYLIQVRREMEDNYETLLNTVVTDNIWEESLVSLAPYWGEDLQFRLVVSARGDYNFDWLQTRVQMAPPLYPVWDLAANLKEARISPDESSIEWRSDGFYSSDGYRLIGQSELLVGGRSVPGQVMLHPYSSEYDSTLLFELPHQQYRTLKTSFGLADEAALHSNGVDYVISVSVDGGNTFTDLIHTVVTTNTWRSEVVDLPPSQDLVIKLSAASRLDAEFDWLQVNLILLPETEDDERAQPKLEEELMGYE